MDTNITPKGLSLYKSCNAYKMGMSDVKNNFNTIIREAKGKLVRALHLQDIYIYIFATQNGRHEIAGHDVIQIHINSAVQSV